MRRVLRRDNAAVHAALLGALLERGATSAASAYAVAHRLVRATSAGRSIDDGAVVCQCDVELPPPTTATRDAAWLTLACATATRAPRDVAVMRAAVRAAAAAALDVEIASDAALVDALLRAQCELAALLAALVARPGATGAPFVAPALASGAWRPTPTRCA